MESAIGVRARDAEGSDQEATAPAGVSAEGARLRDYGVTMGKLCFGASNSERNESSATRLPPTSTSSEKIASRGHRVEEALHRYLAQQVHRRRELDGGLRHAISQLVGAGQVDIAPGPRLGPVAELVVGAGEELARLGRGKRVDGRYGG